jgi:hypothetical protein
MSIELDRDYYDDLCQFLQFEPHASQREVIDAFFSGSRFTGLYAGRRWGKSRLSASIFTYAAGQRDKKIWLVAPTYDLCGKIWYYLAPWLRKTYGSDVRFKNTDPKKAYMSWNTIIECKSTDHPDSCIGEGLDLLGSDETATEQHGKMIWQQQLRATLMDRLGQALFTTTPRGFNWFPEMLEAEQATVFKFPSHSNPYLAREELDAMKRSLDSVAYKQEVLAELVAFVGMVYSMFETEKHVISNTRAAEMTRDWSTCISVDPGLGNPTCIQLIRHNRIAGEDVVIRDYQASGMLFDDVLRIVNEWKPSGGYEACICDIAGKQRSQETGASFVGWMRGHGYNFQHAGVRSITEGINMVRGRLLNTENVTRLWCAENAVHTVKALLNYHYNDKPGPQGEEPVKDNVYDHASDALRYYVTWRYAPRTAWKQH